MTDTEALVCVVQCYSRGVYNDEVKHNLNEVIAMVEKLSTLFDGITPAQKHRAVIELCKRWGVE